LVVRYGDLQRLLHRYGLVHQASHLRWMGHCLLFIVCAGRGLKLPCLQYTQTIQAMDSTLVACVPKSRVNLTRLSRCFRPPIHGKGNKANARDCFGSLTLLPAYNGDRIVRRTSMVAIRDVSSRWLLGQASIRPTSRRPTSSLCRSSHRAQAARGTMQSWVIRDISTCHRTRQAPITAPHVACAAPSCVATMS
jgi:hypothetical protein